MKYISFDSIIEEWVTAFKRLKKPLGLLPQVHLKGKKR